MNLAKGVMPVLATLENVIDDPMKLMRPKKGFKKRKIRVR